ncbi:retrovirus-related pol polyprotein from transposon TNT 1-94, partial [Tanacetum coccineum]
DNDSDVEEDLRSSREFINDLNVEYHERDLLANQKRLYKRSGRVGSARNPMDKSNEICFACGKQGHFQKEWITKTKSFMTIAEEKLSVGRADARPGQWVEITMR